MTENYLAKVDSESFKLNLQDIEELDLITLGQDHYHILSDHQAFDVQLLEANFSKREFTLSINGNIYPVKIEDQFDALLKQLGLAANKNQKQKIIKAPMPGLVLDVLVTEGQVIEKGTHLLILEAMKMENILKSDAPGIIKHIKVEKGNTVEKGQLLIEME